MALSCCWVTPMQLFSCHPAWGCLLLHHTEEPGTRPAAQRSTCPALLFLPPAQRDWKQKHQQEREWVQVWALDSFGGVGSTRLFYVFGRGGSISNRWDLGRKTRTNLCGLHFLVLGIIRVLTEGRAWLPDVQAKRVLCGRCQCGLHCFFK